MADEKNRRLLQGQTIIYPFTKQENIIGLQKTIKEKLPIVSSSQPTSDYVERQVWVDTSDNEQEGFYIEETPQENLTFTIQNNEQGLTFGSESEENDNLTFGEED